MRDGGISYWRRWRIGRRGRGAGGCLAGIGRGGMEGVGVGMEGMGMGIGRGVCCGGFGSDNILF